jgi:hypothetical protein
MEKDEKAMKRQVGEGGGRLIAVRLCCREAV